MPSPDAKPDSFRPQVPRGVTGCSRGCLTPCVDCPDLELTEGWDAGTIEAMTYAGELTGIMYPQIEPVETARADAASAPGNPDAAPAGDRSWLDSRLADIAAKLQDTLKGHDPKPALGAFSERLDNFEARLEAAVVRADAREDRDSLRFIEAHIREIDDQFDKMRSQLSRLDSIDGRLSEIWGKVQQELPAHSGGIEGLVGGAVSRALAAANILRTPSAGVGDEAATAAALQRMEDALGRLIERVEAMEHAAQRAADLNDPSHDDARLSAAYAQGARALGYALSSDADLRSARNLHANDYATPQAVDATSPAATSTEASAMSRSLEELMWQAQVQRSAASASTYAARITSADATLNEFKASALRAKRRAQAAAESALSPARDEGTAIADNPGANTDLALPPPAASAAALAQAHMAAKQARPKRSLASGRWNRGFFLLSIAMLGLGSASYQAVDRMMGTAAERAGPPLASERPQPGAGATRVAQSVTGNQDVPATPVALPPAEAPEAPGATARAEALPATIASAALRHAAANGDPAAEFEIAARYADGRGVAADPAQAFAWYQRAAMHAYVPAQFRLGSHYEQGVGVQKDLERAKVWYRRAAEQGHAKAMHNLAVLMASNGSKSDLAQAAQWFREAAERNLADSQYNLAVMHEAGQGVDVNLAEAFKWYALAARSGDIEAARRMEAIKTQMSKGEIAAAEKAVASWMPQPVTMMPAEPIKAERAAP